MFTLLGLLAFYLLLPKYLPNAKFSEDAILIFVGIIILSLSNEFKSHK